MKAYLIILIFFLQSIFSFSQKTAIERVEPPFWWTQMKNPELQLLVYGPGISNTVPEISRKGIEIMDIISTENPNYLFIYLFLHDSVEAGTFEIIFRISSSEEITYKYELKERKQGSADRKGFSTADMVYLIMPDRFANGNPANDNHPDMLEKADRSDPDGRHGGDIKGIANNLSYIKELGVTALWINPLVENNNPKYSYHGYAITDFYKIDPRYGSNTDYLNLVNKCHASGLKVIMDMVFNHCSVYHWFIQDLPDENWIHQFDEFTRSNFRASTIPDIHASEYDRNKMLTGWFDVHMADLDQRNPMLTSYLIQNTIWWIEYSGIDGIRVDTQPYSYKEFIKQWTSYIFLEYPNFNIVGESWLQKESFTAYFQKGTHNIDGYNSGIPSVTDFPMYFALNKAFNENDSWTEGLARIYYTLAQDHLYGDAYQNLIFADNHDLSRYFSAIGENYDRWKMGMAALATLRGIPMVYYGTELLVGGEEHKGHGYIRTDFPGGWSGDQVNGFTGEGLTELQKKAKLYLANLYKWRKNNKAISEGKLTHFVPENNVYVYFRHTEKECVLVAFNNSKNELKALDSEKYKECMQGYSYAKNIITGEKLNYLETLTIAPKSVLILELLK
ncbi:MAG: glycoside hydrolase family 13 protein [Bacteroidales bacterium]|nr:glycoside hydrolase family 13 protein [Bacteroidales bacterium]MCF8404894.1 glycoside hydrolase family 13 protein [Bacteroidales bacterium]